MRDSLQEQMHHLTAVAWLCAQSHASDKAHAGAPHISSSHSESYSLEALVKSLPHLTHDALTRRMSMRRLHTCPSVKRGKKRSHSSEELMEEARVRWDAPWIVPDFGLGSMLTVVRSSDWHKVVQERCMPALASQRGVEKALLVSFRQALRPLRPPLALVPWLAAEAVALTAGVVHAWDRADGAALALGEIKNAGNAVMAKTSKSTAEHHDQQLRAVRATVRGTNGATEAQIPRTVEKIRSVGAITPCLPRKEALHILTRAMMEAAGESAYGEREWEIKLRRRASTAADWLRHLEGLSEQVVLLYQASGVYVPPHEALLVTTVHATQSLLLSMRASHEAWVRLHQWGWFQRAVCECEMACYAPGGATKRAAVLREWTNIQEALLRMASLPRCGSDGCVNRSKAWRLFRKIAASVGLSASTVQRFVRARPNDTTVRGWRSQPTHSLLPDCPPHFQYADKEEQLRPLLQSGALQGERVVWGDRVFIVTAGTIFPCASTCEQLNLPVFDGVFGHNSAQPHLESAATHRLDGLAPAHIEETNESALAGGACTTPLPTLEECFWRPHLSDALSAETPDVPPCGPDASKLRRASELLHVAGPLTAARYVLTHFTQPADSPLDEESKRWWLRLTRAWEHEICVDTLSSVRRASVCTAADVRMYWEEQQGEIARHADRASPDWIWAPQLKAPLCEQPCSRPGCTGVLLLEERIVRSVDEESLKVLSCTSCGFTTPLR